ncbi:MAG TPA: hypothetical protein VFI29_01840 [Hanamia sp.]|nr:hypothetical protein [Hanamia sp.]
MEMKEYTISIPEDSEEIVTAVMEKFGVKIVEIKKRKSPTKKTTSKKKTTNSKKKIDHTYLFGKWKNFDIDAKKLRQESW